MMRPARQHLLPALQGHRRSGASNDPGRLGLRHHQLRLVDRHRPRGHADLRHPAAAAPGVAHVDQPLRRGHDAVRGGLRRRLSRSSTPGRPWLAYWLFPYPNTMGALAELPQPADLGRVRGLDLRHGVGAVLVRRPHPRPRHAARPRAASRFAQLVYGMLAMGWRGSARALAQLRDRLPAAGRPGHAARGLGAHGGELRLRGRAIVPGWHATIFPPYFVAGAIYAGFAMVLTLAIPLRKFYGLEDFITMQAPREHGQGHARHRPHRGLRLHDGGLHRPGTAATSTSRS